MASELPTSLSAVSAGNHNSTVEHPETLGDDVLHLFNSFVLRSPLQEIDGTELIVFIDDFLVSWSELVVEILDVESLECLERSFIELVQEVIEFLSFGAGLDIQNT